MNELIHNIIISQKADARQILKDSTVERTIAKELKQSLKHKLIKAVIGPRRSGKSTLIHQVLSQLQEPYAYFNFEDERIPDGVNFESISTGLSAVYPNAQLFFFDEIQGYPRWEQLLNRLERLGKRIIISGSNSKLLSSELSSSLTGRHELFEIYPFSFIEYCAARGCTVNLDDFKNYLVSGGFPDVVTQRVLPQKYLRELWDAVILKDIVQRYKIRNVTALKALLNIFRDSLASPFSMRSLERSLQKSITIATVSKFISHGQGAYLTFPLQNFSFKTRSRVNSDKKAYLIDNGFYTSLKTGGQDDYGKLLENYVFIALLRAGLKINLDFFHYKIKSGKEVDFITLQNGRPVELIQVSWSLSNQKTLEREINALIEAAKELRIKELTIVTYSDKAFLTERGYRVKVMPVLEYAGY